jgi:ribonuclease Z
VLHPVIGTPAYELTLVELEPNVPLERDGYLVAPYKVDHRVRAYGYAIVEQDRPGRFDEARALELGVEPGPDFGRLQRGEAVSVAGRNVAPGAVLGETRRGRKVVLTGDTAPTDATRAVSHGADLLIHEATFTTDEAERAAETGHSTARGAAEVAAAAEVAMLALTHVSPRHAPDDLRAEAREVFDATIVPRDFDRVEIPFPERGAPEHIRLPGGQRPAPEPAA